MLGCAHQDQAVQQEIELLQRSLSVHDVALDRALRKSDALDRAWTDVARRFDAAERDFAAAQARYLAASQAPDRDASALAEAAEQSQIASQHWTWAQYLIATAATLDARRMATRRTGTRTSDARCKGAMSTAAYRALLLARGVSLHGMHVDHIVPRALGGADHPSNYQILRSADNQRFGARWSAAKCASAGRAACLRAVRISQACGGFRGGLPVR